MHKPSPESSIISYLSVKGLAVCRGKYNLDNLRTLFAHNEEHKSLKQTSSRGRKSDSVV